MDTVLSLHEVFEAGSTVCGGKGWNLARLEPCGFAVPPGAVRAARLVADARERDEGEIDARFVLVAKRACRIPMLRSEAAAPLFHRLHEDELTVVYERVLAGEDAGSPRLRR